MALNTYLGIDPGLSGSLVSIYSDGRVNALPMPTLRMKRKNGKIGTVLDRKAVLHYLNNLPTFTFCCIEEQIPVRNQHVQAGFTTALNYGMLLMALTAARIEHREVPSAEWQAHFSIVKQKRSATSPTTKAQALEVVTGLYPGLDLRKSSRARVPHEGIVDAVLICLYARETDPKC